MRWSKDALAKLTGQKVHLIISDVNMPNHGWHHVFKAVKQLPTYKFTPVIMLTTESEESKKARRAGCRGQGLGGQALSARPAHGQRRATAVPAMSAAPVLHIEGELTIFRAMELKPVLFGEPPADRD
jgi:CheY-like chemotaxis protein